MAAEAAVGRASEQASARVAMLLSNFFNAAWRETARVMSMVSSSNLLFMFFLFQLLLVLAFISPRRNQPAQARTLYFCFFPGPGTKNCSQRPLQQSASLVHP